jgi:hypothetical protein
VAKIDVLLPVKNGIDFLAESVDSVRAQTFQDWRLLVLDHGSTDGSRELIEDYASRDARIEVHTFAQAPGLSGLLNCGLDLCDSEFVMRHDADDVCFPDRMEKTLAAFAQQADCIALGGQAEVINATGASIGDMRMPVGRKRVAAASFFHNPVAHPTAMLRFPELARLGVCYGQDFLHVVPADQRLEVPSLAEDYFLFGQLAILGRCGNLPDRLIRYRWHGGNVSALRFQEQMQMSLNISRYLARSFCLMHDLPYFDPAPFCNHGGQLLDVGGQRNFDVEFTQMANSLRRGLNALPDALSPNDLERELRFRQAIATRSELGLLWRYQQFQRRNQAETGEWNAIRAWLLRFLPSKRAISVSAG